MSNLPTLSGPHTLVIGIGNPYCGDDAVGIVVARRIKARNPAGVRVVEENGEGAALLDAWQDAPKVIILDAARSGAAPGTVHRFNAHAGRLPSRFFYYSTHAFGVAEAVELARALGGLPPRLIIYGIEGKDFTAGEGLSPEVARAAQEVAQRVREQMQRLTREQST
jgi:hydrogenase maturation protease